MPFPTNTTTVQRPDLGMAVTEYIENAPFSGFIGLEMMPIFPVPEQSATFPVLPKEALLSVPETKRAMRSNYNRGDWEFEEGYYATRENGWEEPLDDRERKLYQSKFDAELVATKRASSIILRSQEVRIATKTFNATNFTAHAVANEWDDAANATPIDDINAGIMAVRAACGMIPNTLAVSFSTFVNLKRCAQVVELLKYTYPGEKINSMSPEQLAVVLNVERVLVGGAVYNGAKNGQNANIADVWNNEYAMLTITSSAPDISEPCLGRTFLWTEDADSNSVVEQYREDPRRSDIFRCRHDTDESFIVSRDKDKNIVSNISQACSYLMSNITT